MKTMHLERLKTLETINPAPLAPWAPSTFTEISIDTDREEAGERPLPCYEQGACKRYQMLVDDEGCFFLADDELHCRNIGGAREDQSEACKKEYSRKRAHRDYTPLDLVKLHPSSMCVSRCGPVLT
jgi:hypothetical protein